MTAHCNERSIFLRGDCQATAGAYYLGVTPFGASWNGGTVRVRSVASGHCSTVDGGGKGDFVNIHQWPCVANPRVAWQQFQVEPVGEGWFRLRPADSGKCAMAVYDLVYQSTCGGYNAERYRVQGALGQNWYSLRSSANTGYCWHVQGSSAGDDINNPLCDDYLHPWIWRIEAW